MENQKKGKEILRSESLPAGTRTKPEAKSSTLPANSHVLPLASASGEGFFMQLKRCLRIGSKGRYNVSTVQSENLSSYRSKSENERGVSAKCGNVVSKASSLRRTSRRNMSDKEEVVLVNKSKVCSENEFFSHVHGTSMSKQNDQHSPEKTVLILNSTYSSEEVCPSVTVNNDNHLVSESDDVFEDIDPGYETLDEIRKKMQLQCQNSPKISSIKEMNDTQCSEGREVEIHEKPGGIVDHPDSGVSIGSNRDSGITTPLTDSPDSCRENHSRSITSSVFSDTTGFADENGSETGLGSDLETSAAQLQRLHSFPADNLAKTPKDGHRFNSDSFLTKPLEELDPENDLYANPKILFRKKSQKQSASEMTISIGDTCHSAENLETESSFPTGLVEKSVSDSNVGKPLRRSSVDSDKCAPPLPDRRYTETDLCEEVKPVTETGSSENISDIDCTRLRQDVETSEESTLEGVSDCEDISENTDMHISCQSTELISQLHCGQSLEKTESTPSVCDNHEQKIPVETNLENKENLEIQSPETENFLFIDSPELTADDKSSSWVTSESTETSSGFGIVKQGPLIKENTLSTLNSKLYFHENNAECMSKNLNEINTEKKPEMVESHLELASVSCIPGEPHLLDVVETERSLSVAGDLQAPLAKNSVKQCQTSCISRELVSPDEVKSCQLACIDLTESDQNSSQTDCETCVLGELLSSDVTETSCVDSSENSVPQHAASETPADPVSLAVVERCHSAPRNNEPISSRNVVVIKLHESACEIEDFDIGAESLMSTRDSGGPEHGAARDVMVRLEERAAALTSGVHSVCDGNAEVKQPSREAAISSDSFARTLSDVLDDGTSASGDSQVSDFRDEARQLPNDLSCNSRVTASIEPIHMSLGELRQQALCQSNDLCSEERYRLEDQWEIPGDTDSADFQAQSPQSEDSGEDQRNANSTSAAQRAFLESMRQLKDCGWYWGPLSYSEAVSKLLPKPDGSFLVRDSSNENYILSLSFKCMGTVCHTRIEHHKGVFSFWSQPDSHGTSTIREFIEQAVEFSHTGKFLYFLRPSGPGSPPIAIRLLYPVSRFFQMPSLQHMCRFLILRWVRRDHIDVLPVPEKVKDYLRENQYYVETLEED